MTTGKIKYVQYIQDEKKKTHYLNFICYFSTRTSRRRQTTFLSSKMSRLAPGPANLASYSVGIQGVAIPRREDSHPPSPSSEIKNEWNYTSPNPIRPS